MEWNIKNCPLALREEVTRPRLKKAGHVIDYFLKKVKLQFDDIFVSMAEGAKILGALRALSVVG